MHTFGTVLVAKHSPENQCFANEGELLVAARPDAKAKLRLRKGAHFFVGLKSGQPSAVAWTKQLNEPMPAEEIVKSAIECPAANAIGATEEEINKQIVLSLSGRVQALGDGKPVVTDFTERTAEDKTLIQTVHRVFLQKIKKNGN